MNKCYLCPRRCGIDRSAGQGFCGAGDKLKVSRVSRHMWEEPCISGTRGSGTVFFSGCQMKCVFCQNRPLSFECIGEEISTERLSELFLELRDSGVHNINLVTPTHFTELICESLAAVRDELDIPVVWNSSGYERPSTLEMTQGLVDIYMPDYKYFSPEIAEKYSGCPDYAEYASASLDLMYSVLGRPAFDDDGLMKRGVLLRHLVLPGCRKDSVDVLREVASVVPADGIVLGLMAQYTPDFYEGDDAAMKRRVTTFEYESVKEEALRLGFDGYMQSPTAACTGFTPSFGDKLTVDLSMPE